MIRIDGSMESLLIVLTGADVRINEDQLHYLDAKQRHVIQEMSQAIEELSNSLEELENSSTAIPYNSATFKEFLERQQRKDQITRQLQTKEATKNTYIAHQRSARVREAFLHLYRQVYHSISKQDAAHEPPPIPIFCVGSTDFNQLLGVNKRHRAPLVFTDPKDTGIPQLSRHIYDLSRRNIFSDIDALVHRCTMLHKETKSFFFCLKLDPKLTAYEDEARGLVERLKDTVYETRLTSEAKIHEYMDELEQVLQVEAKNAAQRGPDIIKDLGRRCRYQTYRAIMSREGEWQSTDLNEDLVNGMLDGEVSSVWHNFFNDFLKSERGSLIMAIRDHCDVVIQSIKDGAKRKLGTQNAARIEKECDGICLPDTLEYAQRGYLSGIYTMQREFGGSFKGLLRDKLEVHYHGVAKQCGPGMFRRMKSMNEKKFNTTEELYAELVDEVMSVIRTAIADGEDSFDTELTQLYSHIERSFVHIHKNDKLSKETRKNMRIFLEREYRKPLAELTALMDGFKDCNTTPVDSEVTAITGQGVPMVQ